MVDGVARCTGGSAVALKGDELGCAAGVLGTARVGLALMGSEVSGIAVAVMASGVATAVRCTGGRVSVADSRERAGGVGKLGETARWTGGIVGAEEPGRLGSRVVSSVDGAGCDDGADMAGGWNGPGAGAPCADVGT